LAVLLSAVALAGGATGANGMGPSASVTTTVVGWEQWLSLEWSVSGGQVIEGYVYNKKGAPIDRVQVLGQGLDATGNIVHQKIEWVPGILPPLQRTYFRIPGMRSAERYRVSVWAFTVVEGSTFP